MLVGRCGIADLEGRGNFIFVLFRGLPNPGPQDGPGSWDSGVSFQGGHGGRSPLGDSGVGQGTYLPTGGGEKQTLERAGGATLFVW